MISVIKEEGIQESNAAAAATTTTATNNSGSGKKIEIQLDRSSESIDCVVIDGFSEPDKNDDDDDLAKEESGSSSSSSSNSEGKSKEKLTCIEECGSSSSSSLTEKYSEVSAAATTTTATICSGSSGVLLDSVSNLDQGAAAVEEFLQPFNAPHSNTSENNNNNNNEDENKSTMNNNNNNNNKVVVVEEEDESPPPPSTSSSSSSAFSGSSIDSSSKGWATTFTAETSGATIIPPYGCFAPVAVNSFDELLPYIIIHREKKGRRASLVESMKRMHHTLSSFSFKAESEHDIVSPSRYRSPTPPSLCECCCEWSCFKTQKRGPIIMV